MTKSSSTCGMTTDYSGTLGTSSSV